MALRQLALSVSCLCSLSLVACVAGEVAPSGGGEHQASLVLGGEELATELSRSPIHEAPAPFARVGLMWDAPAGSDLEISVSADGENFSAWLPVALRHAELEETAAFAGEVEVGGEARFYRIRHSGGAMPTHVVLEVLERRLAGALEDGARHERISTAHQELAVGGAEVRPRSAWGADPPNCVSYHSPQRATIHHTDTSNNDPLSPEARLRQIQSYHQNVRGWCDIGYHFIVSPDGRIWQGRPADRIGSHSLGANTNNVGVAFLGTHTSVPAAGPQIQAVSDLLAGLADEWGFALSAATVKGHRDHTSSTCPGDALYGQLGDLRSGAAGSGGEDDPPQILAGTVTLKGILYEGTDIDSRIAGATVTLGERSSTTNAAGYYEFEDVPEGAYTLTAEADGYLTRTIERTTSAGVTWSSFGLSPAAGDAELVGVVYEGPSSSGRVPFAEVTLSSGVSTAADQSGFYQFDGLPPGEITITATRDGYPTRSITRQLIESQVNWGSVRLD